MTSCRHVTLFLLPEKKDMLRCRKCHLTIKADEIGKGYCPECFERDGTKHYDLEELAAEKSVTARYRCEDCGAVIESKRQ